MSIADDFATVDFWLPDEEEYAADGREALDRIQAAQPNPCVRCLVDIGGEHDCATASPFAAARSARLAAAERVVEAAREFAGQPGFRLPERIETPWLSLRDALAAYDSPEAARGWRE